MKRFIVSFFSFTLGITVWGYEMPKPKVDQLSNGMEVLWFLQDSRPLVDISVVVQNGTKSEGLDPASRSGSTALLLSVMEREVGGKIDDLGGAHGANVDGDSTTMWVHGLSEDTSSLVSILADMVLRSPLDAQVVKKEFDRTLDGMKHLAEETSTLAEIASSRFLKNGTPYADGGFSGIKEFTKIKREDLLKKYQKLIEPKKTMIIVTGRADRTVALPLLEKYFVGEKRASIDNSSNLVKRKLNPKWTVHQDEVLVVDKPGANQVTLKQSRVVGMVTDEDYSALQVGNVILGEIFNSRLNSVIRDQLGLTYGIGSGFSYDRELGLFSLGCATRTEAVGTVLSKSREILAEYIKSGPTEQELIAAKEYIRGSYTLGLSSLHSVAGKWVASKTLGLPEGYWDHYLDRVSKVTAQEVTRALQSRMKKTGWVTVIAGDAKGIEASLKKAGFNRLRRLKLEALIE